MEGASSTAVPKASVPLDRATAQVHSARGDL